ncbi:tyrosine-type recombinase/integrase [Gordonia sp. NPDC003424]
MLRDYVALHLHGPGKPEHDPTAPLFPAFRLCAERPTGVAIDPHRTSPETAEAKAQRNADALASLTVDEAEQRLDLDWSNPVRHQNFYKAVFRPAVLRTARHATDQRGGRALPPALKFHALRHTYASLCVAAGISALEISRFMGHARPVTTLSVYAHLFEDDHADAMSALAAMSAPAMAENVVRLRG